MKNLVVSVHDFSPAYVSELEEILAELDKAGVKRKSIFIIPNLMHPATGERYPLLKSKRTIDLLMDEYTKGSEFSLHGYDHAMGQGYREFKDINYEGASERISKGLLDLSILGIVPDGFVAPFWKLSTEGERAVKDSGFSFGTFNQGIKDYQRRKFYRSKAIWYWPHSRIIDYTFRAFDYMLAASQADNNLARVDIHPQDVWGSRPFESALTMIKILKKRREITDYSGFLNGQL